MTTPDELADRLDAALGKVNAADTTYLAAADTLEERLSDSISSINASIKTIQSAMTALDAAGAAWVDTLRPLRAELATISAAVRELSVPWTPAFPGDVAPGVIRWGIGGGNNDVRADTHELAALTPLGLWRLFSDMTKIDSAVALCKLSLQQGRLPWLSMKPTIPWLDVAAGKLDAKLRDLLVKLDALGLPVWFTLHHEPEGGGSTPGPDDPSGPAGFRAMQEHVGKLVASLNLRNVAFAPVFMAWTWDSRSGRTPDDWWVPGVWDFVGIDLYQPKPDGPAPTDLTMWLNVLDWAKRHDVRLGIAEWGNTGTDLAAGAEVREVYEHLLEIGCVGAAYFDTPTPSAQTGVPWLLTGEPLKVFRELMKDRRSVHLEVAA